MNSSTISDAVTFEIIRHRLWEINDEMGLMAGRLSGSPAVYESGDFNTAILTPDGRGLFVGVYIIRQAAALDLVVQTVLREFNSEIFEGDVFFTTDPWAGALHAMDSAVVAPVFWEGELVAWTGIVMHEHDVGGPRPGSWAVGARNAYQESPIVPPSKLISRGTPCKDVEAFFCRNSRTPEINALNLRAKVASQLAARERLLDIIREYGKDTFISIQDQILDYVRDGVRRRIATLPEGTWYATSFLDHDGVRDRLYRMKLALTKANNKLRFDFTGTCKQAEGSINCTYSGLVGGVLQILFPLLCFDLPWSHGALNDCIEIISEDGTINNATFPAGTSMATVNASQATGNLVAEAMAKMYACSNNLQSEVIALGYGGVNMAVFAGRTTNGRDFVNLFTDTIGGGGARSFADGIDSCANFQAPSYGIPNVERIESLIPVLYVYRKERAETAGAGKYRGGVGLETMIIQHGSEQDMEITFFSTGCSHMETKGVSGGLPGSIQRNLILRKSKIHEQFAKGVIPLSPEEIEYESLYVAAAKDIAVFRPSDVWLNFCTGGGGFGDPLDRDAERVAQDVRRELCSAREASELYGVVLNAEFSVDVAKTQASRTEKRAARLTTGRRMVNDNFNGTYRHDIGKIGDSFAIRSGMTGSAIVCVKCDYVVGAASDDPRPRQLLIERPIATLSPLNQFGSEEVVLREYCCPGCGTLKFVDLHHRDESPLMPEMTLNA